MARNIIITGASRGLGLALAEKFIASGATVYGISKSKTYWKNLPGTLIDSGRFVLFQADLTSEVQVKQCLKKIWKQAGKIDLVVNNAGYGGKLQTVDKIPAGELEKSLKYNLFSAFYVSKHALAQFRKQKKGTMIHISSMAGTRAVPRLFAYSAGKFGMLALSQAMAKENSNWDFKSITVCPGGMNTQMRASLFGKEDAAKQQSTEFVADVVLQIVEGKIEVQSGGHIVIRHGKITDIVSQPAA